MNKGLRIFLLAVFLAPPIGVHASEGERLAYVLGCVNCHHQTPKEIFDAPPLLIVRSYTLDEFQHFLATGNTRTGRDLLTMGSIMGVVAAEQFSYLRADEVEALHTFFNQGWNHERAVAEEAKIPVLHKHMFGPDAAGTPPSESTADGHP